MSGQRTSEQCFLPGGCCVSPTQCKGLGVCNFALHKRLPEIESRPSNPSAVRTPGGQAWCSWHADKWRDGCPACQAAQGFSPVILSEWQQSMELLRESRAALDVIANYNGQAEWDLARRIREFMGTADVASGTPDEEEPEETPAQARRAYWKSYDT